MNEPLQFVDIHCHILPGVDDGATSWNEALAMAQIAADDGTTAIIATPHQMGAYRHNRPERIAHLTGQLRQELVRRKVEMKILPGADVRITADLLDRLRSGQIVTLGGHRRHLLLELPHESYIPLERCIDQLRETGLVGVLSHPERNHALLADPSPIAPLVEGGCLMQVTAGSLFGTFGPETQRMAEQLIVSGSVHFVATDAHGARARRPLMRRAYDRVCELAGVPLAHELCCRNPLCVAQGLDLPSSKYQPPRRLLPRWLSWRKAA